MVIFISSHNPTFVAIFNDKGLKSATIIQYTIKGRFMNR
jgi:hypothetical protein